MKQLTFWQFLRPDVRVSDFKSPSGLWYGELKGSSIDSAENHSKAEPGIGRSEFCKWRYHFFWMRTILTDSVINRHSIVLRQISETTLKHALRWHLPREDEISASLAKPTWSTSTNPLWSVHTEDRSTLCNHLCLSWAFCCFLLSEIFCFRLHRFDVEKSVRVAYSPVPDLWVFRSAIHESVQLKHRLYPFLITALNRRVCSSLERVMCCAALSKEGTRWSELE
jgi:hypothetical protein